MSVQKIDRNKEIIAKKLSGATYEQLAREYDLSISGLMGIIQRWKYNKAIEQITKLETINKLKAGEQ